MVVPSPSLSEKQLRRAALRQARREFVATLSPGMRLQASADLSQVLRPLLEKATVVGGYHAVGSEIDPAPALHLAEQLGATIALPAFAGHGEPMLFRTGPADGIGPYAIAQSSGDEVRPDLLLVPLLAIDRVGHRMGQGGGHYDRALPALRTAGARLIGIGWQMQRVMETLPHDPWDVPLDGFASPDGLEWFR